MIYKKKENSLKNKNCLNNFKIVQKYLQTCRTHEIQNMYAETFFKLPYLA